MAALNQLMGAYFHQDWDLHGDEWDVVDLFIQHDPMMATALHPEISRVLDTYSDEASLKQLVVDDLGAYYLADVDGGSYRGWLAQIAERARAATAVVRR